MSKSSEHNNLLVKTSIVAEQQPPSQPSNYRGERVRKKSVIDKILYTETLPLEYDHKIMEISENNLAEDSESIGEKRERWNSFMEYFLSIIGFVIDLGNVWRFPTVCFQNGGGAFLIPFLVCLFIIGMPCMYLELAAGQYFQSGNITIWAKMAPYMKGIGYTCVIINILMLSYYNTLQSYALYYLFYSFQSPVPWSVCGREWNSPNCIVAEPNATAENSSNVTDHFPANEFFNRKLLGAHHSKGFNDMDGLKWDLVLCVFVVFVMTTGCLVGGIRSSGKAVYVTALLPYICLAVLIGQSLFLKGSYTGLKYYLTPNFSKIFDYRVWLAAAVQTFFSLGPGFGVLITYASYTKKNTNIKNLTIMCSVVNCLTSLLYGVVVFAGLGYMAERLHVGIEHFLKDGIGIVYVVYPEIIATFRMPYLFAIVFFIMLITLGMDSAFGGMEGLYTAIVDEYPWLKKHALVTRIVISGVPFITCLPTVTYAGIFVVQWLDRFAISPSVLLVVFVEVITVSWFYGLDKFCAHVQEMNGIRPYANWRISWKYICPIALLTIVILDIVFFERLSYGNYQFPEWSGTAGFALNCVALLPIPGYALFYFVCINRQNKNKKKKKTKSVEVEAN